MRIPERIEIRNDVMGGKPCIAGTRIPVYLILQLMGAGETEAAILAAYPQLVHDDIYECLHVRSNSVQEIRKVR